MLELICQTSNQSAISDFVIAFLWHHGHLTGSCLWVADEWSNHRRFEDVMFYAIYCIFMKEFFIAYSEPEKAFEY